jgi:hypothetical protein
MTRVEICLLLAGAAVAGLAVWYWRSTDTVSANGGGRDTLIKLETTARADADGRRLT